MELDNLKEAWTALDNRLKHNEKLNESIILEMIKSKAGKKVNRFIALEILSVAGLLLMVPFCIYCIDRYGGKIKVWDIFMIFLTVLCFVYPFWGAYKLHGLMKFDLTKNVGNNILCMNRYDIQLKHEKKILTYFLGPVLVIFGVLSYAAVKAALPFWALLICVFSVAGLASYWSYKIYHKSIESILKSLEEIRELKEEQSLNNCTKTR